MSFADIGTLDIFAIGFDAVVILSYLGYLIYTYSQSDNCRLITIRSNQIRLYRIHIYTAVSSSWLIAYFIFGIDFWLKYPLLLLFAFSTVHMLKVSLPAWICKKKKMLGTCACDYYEYDDLIPMIIYAAITNLVFSLVDWTLSSAGIYLLVLLFGAFLVYRFSPKKKIKALELPPELVMKTADEFQAFITFEPEKPKIVIIASDSCKFCDFQVSEINAIPLRITKDRLRVLDITDKKEVDLMILFSLNLDPSLNFGLPISFTLNGGICVNQKEGAILRQEMEEILS